MRDRPRPTLRSAAFAAGLALFAAFPSLADGLPNASQGPDPGAGAMCKAPAQPSPQDQAGMERVRRLLAEERAPTEQAPMALNGAGYNYGSGSAMIDAAAIEFEAKQAR